MLGGLYFWETERVVAAVQIGLMLYNTVQRDANTPNKHFTPYSVEYCTHQTINGVHFVEFN